MRFEMPEPQDKPIKSIPLNNSPYTIIFETLSNDCSGLWNHFRNYNKHGFTPDIDPVLVARYKLAPNTIPHFSLPNTFPFMDGFSYVAGHWYPIVRAVASDLVRPNDYSIMDTHLERMFRDRVVQTQELREEFRKDPSGANWLDNMAIIEFKEGTLSFVGAKKAITGVRNMFTALN